VRNVLLHTFDLVEGVVTDSTQIAKALTGWDSAPDTTSESDTKHAILGWQEATLNKNGVCDTCNVILPVGERAAIGLPISPRATLLCLDCLAALSSAKEAPPKLTAPKKGRKRSSKVTSTATGK
jgi:hypothetical protein